jgi:HD-GYP domain-containing protein (c-di-GMP phosphodiesterase class II)
MDKNYFRIRITSLIPDMPTSFNLYLQINQKYILYLHAGDTLTKEKIEKLNAKQSDIFYVPIDEKAAYKAYIQVHLDSSSLSSQHKAQILRESSFTLIEELFEQADISHAIEGSKEAIQQFVSLMDQEPEAISHLIGLSTHDFYTYNHSLDVSIYSLGLGKAAGLDVEALNDLGQGALFHDIGKRHVSTDIICKKGPLNEIEWAQMRLHPAYGLKILNEYDSISEGMKAACFEHHEHFLGNGYPQGIAGEEIHPFGRIVAIADCYDAMTTQRSYNKPMRPTQALAIMQDKISDKFDPDLLKTLQSILFQLERSSA